MAESVDYVFAEAKRPASRVAAACPDIGAIARNLLAADLTPGRYLDRLVRERLYVDAVRFIAYALPARHAVWWAAMCLAEINDVDALASEEKAAFKATIDWVVRPDESHRAETERRANVLSGDSVYRWLGRSAAHIEFPLPKPVYSELQDFRARGIAMCLIVAMAKLEADAVDAGDPDCTMPAWRTMIALGYDVSRGKLRWPGSES